MSRKSLKDRLAAAQAEYASRLGELEHRLDDALREAGEAELLRQKALYDDLFERFQVMQQTHGLECSTCGWAMRFPDQPCRCELVEERQELLKVLRMLWSEVIFSKAVVADPVRAAVLEALRSD
jgi:hypothetical protein